MGDSLYWADGYVAKRCTVEKAIGIIKPGNRVFIGSACGEPQKLIRELAARAVGLSGVEIVRMMHREITSFADIADKTQDHSINVRNIYLGSADTDQVARHMRFITPLNISEVPGLFMTRKLPIDVALIQVSPPDDFGWMSLGISVDVTLSAAQSADIVVAQVNINMPRTMGQSFVHVNDVDCIVEYDEPLLSIQPTDESDFSFSIGKHIAVLIADGSTLQLGLGIASRVTFNALREKNDLGFHSQYITDDVMHLYSIGAINGRKKGFLPGKLVASSAIGSSDLYEFLHDNPAAEFRPSDFVNDPFIISRNNRMVSVNVARIVDLMGQVSAEASNCTMLAGVSGIPDFVRGAKRSNFGKSIIVLNSTSRDGKVSNIVSSLSGLAVVVTMGDIQYVVTEYGSVNLFGKSMQERALAMISIAHPDFREKLLQEAKDKGLIGKERNIGRSTRGIYPIHMEEVIVIDGENITIRPVKPVDERRIQEHYYKLDRKDVKLRFLHDKSSFNRSDLATRLHIDYVRNLTLVGIIGEFGFGRIIGLAECLMMVNNDMAEVAFSISKEYQNKGLGKIFLKKLYKAAMKNGISGLLACTSVKNKAMVNLFKTLPYKVEMSFDDGLLVLKCRFDEIKN